MKGDSPNSHHHSDCRSTSSSAAVTDGGGGERSARQPSAPGKTLVDRQSFISFPTVSASGGSVRLPVLQRIPQPPPPPARLPSRVSTERLVSFTPIGVSQGQGKEEDKEGNMAEWVELQRRETEKLFRQLEAEQAAKRALQRQLEQCEEETHALLLQCAAAKALASKPTKTRRLSRHWIPVRLVRGRAEDLPPPALQVLQLPPMRSAAHGQPVFASLGARESMISCEEGGSRVGNSLPLIYKQQKK